MAGVGRKKAAVIEVDQNNFQQLKPTVQNAIRQSAFVAFDCEFTGLHRERQQGATVLLSARSRYAHLRQEIFGGGFLVGKCQCGTELIEASNYCHHCGSPQRADQQEHVSHKAVRRQEFLIAQVGIACYIYNEEKKVYDIKCFSFYLSPRPWSGAGGGNVKIEHDIRFSCMGSSLKFLGDHSFDFNRWINDGIPFMSRHQYNMEKEKIHKRGHYANIKDLDNGKGFLEIWEFLITSGKPLVGHQCFLDILYLWHQLEGPLSKELPDVFKELNSKVKVLVDTKHLLTWYPKDLTSMCEREAVSVRQLKLNRLKADLAEKERILKENKEKMGEEATSRGSTPARDGMVSPVPSASDNIKNKQDEKEELQRRSSEMHTAIKEKVFKEMLKQLKGEDLGNRFRSMQLQEIHKLVFPVIQDVVPAYSAREHDAGYDAYMTGAVFLAIFMLMHDSAVVPNSRTIIENHTVLGKKRDPGSPQSFNFINKIHIFAAPYFLETTSPQLPSLDESHSTTYIIGGGDTAHIEAQRLQNDIKKVDPFGEIYWIEFQKRCAVILFRRDLNTVDLYKRLSEVVAPLQVTCAVKPKKVTPSANALALLKTQLSKKKALAMSQSSRQPKSPTSQLTVQVDAQESNASPISSSASPRAADDPASPSNGSSLADLLPVPPLPKRRSKRLHPETSTGTLKIQKAE